MYFLYFIGFDLTFLVKPCRLNVVTGMKALYKPHF